MIKQMITALFGTLIALLICCGCSSSSVLGADQSNVIETSSSEGNMAEELSCEGTALHWQLPQCKYHILDTVAGEDGFAVLYEEIRPRDEDDEVNFCFLMVQTFDEQGNHEITASTSWPRDIDDSFELNTLHLDSDKLYFTLGQDERYGVDRATGAVSYWRYQELLRENNVSLSYSYEDSNSLKMHYCLTKPNGVEHEIVVPEFDYNFDMALNFLVTGEEHDDRPGITYTAKVSLDADAKTAEISNTKLTYKLDFNNLSYTCERKYTYEMLEDVLAVSPDGTLALRCADTGGEAETIWMDIVLARQDGVITYLCYCTSLYNAYFFDDNTVLLNLLDELRVYDLSGDVPLGRSLLDLGEITDADGDKHTERLLIGMSVDHKNKLMLAATRDYTDDWDTPLPVTLTVFDENLKQIAAIDTGYNINIFNNCSYVSCEIILNGDGTANIGGGSAPPVQVKYLQ